MNTYSSKKHLIGMGTFFVFALTAAIGTFGLNQQSSLSTNTRAAAISGTTYYVDCQTGNDSNSGTSDSTAWKNMTKANTANLQPGDGILFKKNCSWIGPLKARWNGTVDAPITISAYGEGSLPLIYNSTTANNVEITGTHQVLEYLETKRTNAPTDPACENQTYGFYTGFNFMGSSYNTIQYSKASLQTAGIHFNRNPNHHNKVLHNEITNNNVMQVLTAQAPPQSEDIGAWGINLKGDDNEIAYNYLKDNNAWCSYDLVGFDHGNTIELFIAKRNLIHHNIAINDRVFSEIGGDQTDPTKKSEDNIFAYNLHVAPTVRSRFIVNHGNTSAFGPARGTKAYNNTVYLTGPQSQAIICNTGCAEDLLELKNNIVWSEMHAIQANGPINEGFNLYWATNGNPQISGITIAATSRIADPRFLDIAQSSFELLADSPAIDQGTTGLYDYDLDYRAVPQGLATEMGAYEYVPEPTIAPTDIPAPSETPVPTETMTPIPTETPIPTPTTTVRNLKVFAAGTVSDGVYPTMDIFIRGAFAQRIYNIDANATLGQFETYEVPYIGAITASEVQIRYINDGNSNTG
ncbi:MAG: choice-of-anchor Q domain-containing protein, partial [Weeksellaceae bacterium]